MTLSAAYRALPLKQSVQPARLLPPAALAFLGVGFLARKSGGWWPATWGWAAVAFFFVAAAALLLSSRVALGRLDLALLGALGLLGGWTGLSWLWSESPTRTALELERAVMYAGAVAAMLLLARREAFAAALAALLAVDTAIAGHALLTRFAPDRFANPSPNTGFRLAGFLGYANALGIVAVLGLLLAAGFVLDGRARWARSAAAAASVPLALALYLSFSRGAWLSLLTGLAVLAAFAPRRRRVAAAIAPLAAVDALAIWLTSRSAPLTGWADPAAAVHDGHRMLIVTLALAAAAAALARPLSRSGVIAALAVAGACVALAPSPGGATASRAGASAAGAAEETTGRVFDTGTSLRLDYWRVAAMDALRHPLAGSGAGTFVREWYRHRRVAAPVQDAHNVYLQTTAELGLVGLVALLAALAIPLVAAIRVRRSPFVAATAAAYVAFLAHAGVDWDWQLPAVAVGALFCGALLVVRARDDRPVAISWPARRAAAVGIVTALLAFSFVGLVGNRAEASALAAAWRADWRTTQTEASLASTWAPWSAEALVLEADAASARREPARARELLRLAVAKDSQNDDLWARLAAVTTGAERARARAEAARLDPLGNRTG